MLKILPLPTFSNLMTQLDVDFLSVYTFSFAQRLLESFLMLVDQSAFLISLSV